jgi:NADPH-dependent curcumin reductase CurA
MAITVRTNRLVRLRSRPAGLPGPENWDTAEAVMSEPKSGELLVKLAYVSLDPAMRMWMNAGRSYIPPVEIGDVMRAIGLGRVLVSEDPRFSADDYVTGLLGVQEYALVRADEVTAVDPTLAPLPVHLSALGLTGMSAYFGLLDIGQPRPGETVVVSAAAGAVGSIVGQIAKIQGARAIGIAGGVDKCRYVLDELGFDAAIDYKRQNVSEALAELAPERVDVYFDNVGGDVLDAVLANLARGARVVISGAISQYNADAVRGPANYMALAVDRARMQGFIVTDFADRFGEAAADIAGWIATGKLRSQEKIVEGGIDRFPEALLQLFSGESQGKLLLKVGEE